MKGCKEMILARRDVKVEDNIWKITERAIPT